ncbi:MAG: DUF368 domain-containing protein [Gammaproteobacteria bacterium]|jgi:putative membrane protein|nr:DUF368 domain-containing protein [Gammaproteobacteria bacterium]
MKEQKEESHFLNKKRLMLFLKGMAMGAADTVPGVSGGTIAFITNIYEELIFSIQACNLKALQLLFEDGFKSFWTYINGDFLLTLFLGIIFAAVILANFVGFLLESFEYLVMTFFVGLILSSSLFLRKQIQQWNWQKYLLLSAGILLAVLLNFIPGKEDQINLVYVFLSAAIAICAMILPGISGAFILVLLGAYEGILEAVRSFDIVVLVVFVSGCVAGLICFSNILAYCLKHWRDEVLVFLLGILLGSLYTIWPSELNLFEQGTSYIGIFIAITLFGFSLVYFLEKKMQSSNKQGEHL